MLKIDKSEYPKGSLAFVHRYRYSHEKRRKQLKRALKDGKVELIEKPKDGFLYRIIE